MLPRRSYRNHIVHHPRDRDADDITDIRMIEYLSRLDILAIILAILLMIAHIVMLSMLPDTVPRHFNLHMEPSGEASKYDWAGFAMPVFALLMALPLSYLKCEYCRREDVPYKWHFTLISLISVIIAWITWAFVMSVTVSHTGLDLSVLENLLFLPLVLGSLLIISGILMQYVRRNIWFGLRVDATLSDERVWKEANKASGLLFIVTGVTMILLSLYIDEENARKWLAISLTVVAAVLSLLTVRHYSNGHEDDVL